MSLQSGEVAVCCSHTKVKIQFIILWYLAKRGLGERSQNSNSLHAGQFRVGIPVQAKFFCIHLDWPWGPLSSLYNGYEVFPCSKAAKAWQ